MASQARVFTRMRRPLEGIPYCQVCGLREEFGSNYFSVFHFGCLKGDIDRAPLKEIQI